MEKYEEALRDRELISEQETVDILKRFERKKKYAFKNWENQDLKDDDEHKDETELRGLLDDLGPLE